MREVCDLTDTISPTLTAVHGGKPREPPAGIITSLFQRFADDVGTRRYDQDASERMTLSRCLSRYLARHPGNRTSPRTVPQGKSRQVTVTCK